MATSIDNDRLEAFVGQIVDEVGGTLNTALVAIGDRLGLYRAMADSQPLDAAELAARTGTHERHVQEWLNTQAASGFVSYDPQSGRYALPAEQALALTDESSPIAMAGAFQTAMAALDGWERVAESFKTGAGVGWHEHHHDLFDGTERFFAGTYRAELVGSWLPALDGVVEKLEAGARVADVGCGHGASTILMAEAYPRSTFVGYDYHRESIATASQRAEAAGVAERVAFAVGAADEYPTDGYDLIATFDALHDMGDPVAAARHAREALGDDGTWMIVEPRAGDRVEDNLNPVGRFYYAFSTLACTPGSLAQPGRAALGAQAGEARLSEVIEVGGFSRVRRATESPFNVVLEARP